jgi:hypothetical protein
MADLKKELSTWWIQKAKDEVDMVVDKAVDYGATDLYEIGRSILILGGKQYDRLRATEAGIYFYEQGKMARWQSAIMEGRPTNPDTILDIGVYSRMAQRVLEVGGWPI